MDDPTDDVTGVLTGLAADTDDADDAPTRTFDPGTLVIGVWFAVLGIVAAVVGADLLDGLPPVVIPISFAVVGLALLVPKRRVARRPKPDW